MTSGVLSFPTISDTLISRNSVDVLTNKILQNDTCNFVDPTDNTKKITFNLSGASASTVLTLQSNQANSNTIIIPDTSDILVCLASIQTLTNKTFISPSFSTINNGGVLTLPTTVDTI